MRMFFLLSLSLSVWANEEHGKLPSGVVSYDDHTGVFSLDPRALKNFSIKCAPVQKDTLPFSALVKSRHETSIYRCLNGSFQRTKLQDLKADESLVVQGANFLKTVELSLEEGPAEGHGH